MDGPAFDRALGARRRLILQRFVGRLRVDTVSPRPARVRAGAARLAHAVRAPGPPGACSSPVATPSFSASG